MYRGAWWATLHGVAKSQTLLRQLSMAQHRKLSTSVSLTKPLTVSIIKKWKILKEMGVLDHLTCLWRNLCAGQESTVRTGHEQLTGLNLEKE